MKKLPTFRPLEERIETITGMITGYAKLTAALQAMR